MANGNNEIQVTSTISGVKCYMYGTKNGAGNTADML
jgi:hypothetical protein